MIFFSKLYFLGTLQGFKAPTHLPQDYCVLLFILFSLMTDTIFFQILPDFILTFSKDAGNKTQERQVMYQHAQFIHLSSDL